MSKPFLATFGGNLMAVPAIRRMRERGHAVCIIDGNAEAPAQNEADHFVHANFSDVEKTVAALEGIPVSGSMPLNDFAIAAASQVARERGLPGWSVRAETCLRSKVAMKKAWLEAGLPTARAMFATVDAISNGVVQNWSRWPCVVKPSFSGGGSRGVFVAHKWSEIREGLARVEKRYLDREVVIEEFIDGSEHTLEVVVCRGEPRLLTISDKENYPGSATVVQNLYFPGPIGTAHRHILEPLVLAGARAIGATDGTLHFEVLLRGGKGYLLEVGGRPGGGLNFHPICELSAGYDYPGILAAILTGAEPDFSRGPTVSLAWHYFPAGKGVLRSVDGFEAARSHPQVVDAMLYEKIGASRFGLEDDLARPGYFLVRGASVAEAKACATALVESVHFITD